MADQGNAYEQMRQANIAANRKKLEELGLMKASSNLDNLVRAVKVARAPVVARKKVVFVKRRPKGPPRRSARIGGADVPDYAEVAGDDDDGLVDLLEGVVCGATADGQAPAEGEAPAEVEVRVAGGRKVKDNVVGISCHYCRQKAVCEEEGCPRCTARDTSKECIGKSQCQRCMGSRGVHCRGCLLNRYGYDLEEARRPDWLCPHCYEEEHPDELWFCNQSNCLPKRGCKATGIAAPLARSLGFKSVAHMLQHQMRERLAAGLPISGAVQTEASEDDKEQQPQEEEEPQPQPRPRRRATASPGPNPEPAQQTEQAAKRARTSPADGDAPAAKRGPGRPRKTPAPLAAPAPDADAPVPDEPAAAQEEAPAAKRGPGRPRKALGVLAATTTDGLVNAAPAPAPAAQRAPAAVTGVLLPSPAQAACITNGKARPAARPAGGSPQPPAPAAEGVAAGTGRAQRAVRPTAKALALMEAAQAKTARAAAQHA